MPEWSNGADSKSVELLMWFLGFESLSLRHVESQEATTTGQILQGQILAGFFLFWGYRQKQREKGTETGSRVSKSLPEGSAPAQVTICPELSYLQPNMAERIYRDKKRSQ